MRPAAAAGNYAIGNNLANGLINFDIEQRGNDAFIIARPNAAAFDPITLPNFGTDSWYQSADIYTNYAAIKRSDLNRGITGIGGFIQGYFGRDKYGGHNDHTLFGADFDVDERVETKRRGIQAGVDYNFGSAVVGLTAGWQKAENERRFSLAGFEATGWNVGLYGNFGSDLGFYAASSSSMTRSMPMLTMTACSMASTTSTSRTSVSRVRPVTGLPLATAASTSEAVLLGELED
jgi:hypothetical protein